MTIAVADYSDARDGQDLLKLLDTYARDLMGGGDPLSEDTRVRLLSGLGKVPGAFSLIARIDGAAVGLANCFMGYSTFAAAPLVNVHDFVVVSEHRGRGIGKALMAAIDAEASRRGACKITLEVLTGNDPAKSLYVACGFGDYQLDPASGHALFWQKKL
ncbi:MAG: GNAT family N-acetyltransferase [Sphingomicrobium sp.]